MSPDVLKNAFCAVWPDNGQRSARLLDLYLGLLEARRWQTAADLMRAVGIRESSVWDLIERTAVELDIDEGEVFRILYQPEGLDDE